MEPTTAQISAFPLDHPGTPIDQPPLYETIASACFVGDAQDLLSELPPSSIDLMVTSSLYAPSSRKSRCGPVRLDRWGPAPDAVSRHEPAYPLGPRFAGPRQGLAGGCAPSDPPNGNGTSWALAATRSRGSGHLVFPGHGRSEDGSTPRRPCHACSTSPPRLTIRRFPGPMESVPEPCPACLTFPIPAPIPVPGRPRAAGISC